jgi:hypothetical protein
MLTDRTNIYAISPKFKLNLVHMLVFCYLRKIYFTIHSSSLNKIRNDTRGLQQCNDGMLMTGETEVRREAGPVQQ